MAFPQTILDFKAHLNLGTWTDITDHVYQRNGAVSVSRGRPDESTSTNAAQANVELNNRDGRFSPRNPVGSYYGSIGRNTPLKLSVPDQSTYLRLEDDATSNVTTPDSVGLSITGDTEIQIDIKPTSYTTQALAAKWNPTAGTTQNSWVLFLNEDGTLQFFWSTTGADFPSAQSTASIPLGRIAIKVTIAVSTGTVTFYTAPTIGGSWTQLGSAVVHGSTSIFDSTTAVSVGNYTVGEGNGLQGRVYGFKLLSGIGGTVKASPDFTSATAGATTLTDAQGNVWTVQGTAEFSNRKYRFHGEVAAWPQRWDTTGNDVWTPVQAAGLLQRLGQGAAPLESVLRRYWTTLTGSLAPIAYWPCEDGSASTQIASGLAGGGRAMKVSGKPNFASDTGFAASAAIPVINGSTWTGIIPRYNTTGTDLVVRFLLHVPAAGDTNNARIVTMYTTGTINEVALWYKTGGALEMFGFDSSGNTLFDTGSVSFGVNGALFEVQIALVKSGANVNYSVTAVAPGATTGTTFSGTQTSAHIGTATQIQVNPSPGSSLSGTALGQITLQTTSSSIFTYGQQLAAYAGETAGDRFTRLCAEQGINSRVYGFPASTRAMGPQGQETLLALLQECEAADGGMIYEPRESLSLGYRTRESMENQAAAVTLNYTTADLGTDSSTSIEPTDDDQFTRNDVTVTRSNGTISGSSSRQVDTTSAMSVNSPPAGVGDYADSVNVNLYVDSQVDDQAGWRLHLGTANEPRYPSIPLNLARSELAGNSTKYYGIQDVDQGDFIDVQNLPVWLPPGDLKQLAVGFQEKMGGYVYTIDWQCMPESPYEIGVVGTGAASDDRADTDGSTLHASCTSAATSITVDTTVQTTEAAYLWTTTAGDFPFDIMVGGERMTVTNITGSSSPQTFTVTRSVNGVVKAHSALEAVNVYDYAVIALDDPF